ncbi:MAG: chitinase-like protein cluster D [Terrestrivirus sp.]|uniref:Chitinase-like protein cluster D n=1 Tax=Terrestrivirus sp. TaxID=2487775 RepID=A0A3G4ZNI2_9VIRU|nr:MAG: chitinase-like protein cluster D [Terrestrivirus sp.]
MTHKHKHEDKYEHAHEHEHQHQHNHRHGHLGQSSDEFTKKVIYFDYLGFDWNDPTPAIKDAINTGYNVINLAFYLSKNPRLNPPAPGPTDVAEVWGNLSQELQKQTIDYAHERGAKILVSAGGGTDETVYEMDPATFAGLVCRWAIDNNLDGVDYDLEYIQNGFLIPGKTSDETYEWFKQLNITSRTILGPDRIISHAPQAPYLSQPGHSGTWAGTLGGYVKVFNDAKNNGGSIDYLNIQFYNQGDTYNSYQTIFIDGAPNFPFSAINQVATQGPNIEILPIPLGSLVYGTYLHDGSGFHDPEQIKQFMARANNELGWNAGTMLWLWDTTGDPNAKQWFEIIYG